MSTLCLILGFHLCIFIEYVNAVKSALFTTSEDDLSDTVKKYKKKAPEPLCKQFTDRRSKQDAIKRHKQRKALDCHALFPSCEYCRSYKLYSTKNILK